MRIASIGCLAALITSLCGLQLMAQEEAPSVALVLSGGGARGMAHIGVIRALEERNIKVHAIVGTSVGALVGALYASGKTPNELESILLGIDWNQTLTDQPVRNSLSHRRKKDARDYLVNTQATLAGGVIKLPKGLIQGQNLQLTLQRLFSEVSQIRNFDQLPIPFRAVAADLVTGEAVTFAEGSLATAVRASMSIPGLFAPVEIDGRMLVDGGIANNMPVDVAKSLGVDSVIAVDLATPLFTATQLNSVIPIIEQLTTLLTFNQLKRQYALISSKDILIEPELDGISNMDFEQAAVAIERGYSATNLHHTALARWASTTPASRAGQPIYSPPLITDVQLDNNSSISAELISAHISQPLGLPLDSQALERDLEMIYGYQYFEAVGYEVEPNDSGNLLRIVTRERSWGKDLLGISFELNTGIDGESSYTLGANYRKSAITRYGGEWLNAFQIGQESLFRTELYLPINYQQAFFTTPYLHYTNRQLNHVIDAELQSRFRIQDLVTGIFFGLEISNIAIVGLGSEHHQGEIQTAIGVTPALGRFSDRVNYLKLEADTLDNLDFPSKGTFAALRYEKVYSADPSANRFSLLHFDGVHAVPLRRNAILLNARFVRSFDAVAGRHFQSSLGGFKQISGLYDGALVGSDLAYFSLTWMQRLNQQRLLPVDLPMHLAVVLEAGNVWQNSRDLNLRDLIFGGALILGVDSPLGPIYLGYGQTEKNQRAFYLKLGRIF